MPTGFDTRALYLTSAFVFLGLLVSVIFAYRELRGTRGLGRFVSAYCALIAGTGLFAFRDRIPDVLTIVVANVLVILGAALVLEGIALFYGLTAGFRITIASALLSAPVFAWFTWVQPSSQWRTVFSGGALAVLLGAAAWTAGRGGHEGGSRVLDFVTATALGTCALLFLVRAALVAAGRSSGDLLAEGLLTVLGPLVGILSAVVWTTSLLTNANRRLTHVVRSQTDLLTNLFDVARVTGDEASLDATLERTLEAVRSLTGAGGSSLLLVDEEGHYTRGLFTTDRKVLVPERAEAEAILRDGLAGWVVREKTAALVPDILTDPRWKMLPDPEKRAIRSALSAPVSSGPVLVGVLSLVDSRPRWFNEDQLRLLESTTAQIALVLRNAQIADARMRATRQKELLNEILGISARGTLSEEIAREAAEAMTRSPEGFRASVVLPSESGRLPPAVDGAGSRSHLAVPLNHRGQTLGVLVLERTRSRAFEPADVSFAEALAEAIALGLGNAMLLRVREELTRAMVHDLRNPVVSVKGSLELLRDEPGLSETGRKLVHAAEQNAKRQEALITGILELSRLEAGDVPVQRVRVPVEGLISDVIRLTTPRAGARALELRAELPVELPEVVVDADLIARVLENLLGNAIKFSPPGAGPVTVSARSVPGAVEIRVSDSGPGVGDEVRPRLFQKFTPGNLTGRGAGLGLAFCRLAVEANGGRIQCEQSASGAVFSFTVPVVPPPAGLREQDSAALLTGES